MKSMTIETLSGKVYHIENVGDVFIVLDKEFVDLTGGFSSLNNAINYVVTLSR